MATYKIGDAFLCGGVKRPNSPVVDEYDERVEGSGSRVTSASFQLSVKRMPPRMRIVSTFTTTRSTVSVTVFCRDSTSAVARDKS